MKLLIGILIGFLLKMSLYEASNYAYQYVYMKAIKSVPCQNHVRSPHICASEIVEKNNVVTFLIKLDTNLGIWECNYPFSNPKPFICKLL